jgi:hypothetical protein
MPRTPWLWPFRHDSPWNLPVAVTAEFEAADAPATASLNTTTGVVGWINWNSYNNPITPASLTDPLATVTDVTYSKRSAVFRIPTDAVIAGGTDSAMTVISPDGRWVHECFGTTRNSATDYTVRRHEKADLYGHGIGPNGGTHASGGSQVGGIIRTWETIQGEINHALAVAIDFKQLKYTSGGSGSDKYGYGTALGYVWPATEQDYNSATAYKGQVPMGAYFAIPPSVDLTTLGLSGPGLVLATALQRYGGYVVDASTGCVAFVAEQTVDGTWVAQAKADLAAIRRQLRIVTNNTPATPNGGPFTGDDSNRVAPLAPALPTPPRMTP